MTQQLEFARIDPSYKSDCGHTNCRICWESHVVGEVLGRADFSEMADLITELHNHLSMTGEDNAYYQAIIGGSWGSSVEHLEHALGIAKKMRVAESSKP